MKPIKNSERAAWELGAWLLSKHRPNVFEIAIIYQVDKAIMRMIGLADIKEREE